MPLCELCEREVERTTKHHLVPKSKGGRYGATVALCQPCHKSLHHLLSNRELAKSYNTVEKLQAAPELQTYLEWIRKRKVERISF
jgi:5-methylcytosine-specific restriction enzyme A